MDEDGCVLKIWRYEMEYDVVYASSVEGLIKKVNQMIAEGWQLQGGVTVSTQDGTEYYFYQAVVKNA